MSEHDFVRPVPAHQRTLSPVVVIAQRQSISPGHDVGLVELVADLADAVNRREQFLRLPGANEPGAAQRGHRLQHLGLLVAQWQRAVRRADGQAELAEEPGSGLRGRAGKAGGLHAGVADFRHLADAGSVVNVKQLAQRVELQCNGCGHGFSSDSIETNRCGAHGLIGIVSPEVGVPKIRAIRRNGSQYHFGVRTNLRHLRHLRFPGPAGRNTAMMQRMRLERTRCRPIVAELSTCYNPPRNAPRNHRSCHRRHIA